MGVMGMGGRGFIRWDTVPSGEGRLGAVKWQLSAGRVTASSGNNELPAHTIDDYQVGAVPYPPPPRPRQSPTNNKQIRHHLIYKSSGERPVVMIPHKAAQTAVCDQGLRPNKHPNCTDGRKDGRTDGRRY